MDKYLLSERDICTKFITPAIGQAGWAQHQFREEVQLTDGRVMVRGKLAARIKNPDAKGGSKREDYVLYARPGIPIAVVEAKQAKFAVGQAFPDADIVSAVRRQLSWTHIKALIYIDDPLKREFYVEMCKAERWSTRSAAAAVVLGRNAAGRNEWKDSKGRMLKELQALETEA